MIWEKIKSTWLVEALFLTIISALVYLPQVGKLSFHSDDWYFIYNALVLGPQAFIDLTLHTRPIRGPLYQILFSLYGLHPLPYNLTIYFWRLLGGLGALWLFNLLWPKHKQANFFLAVLFMIFPGFLWWVSGFEFQPYVLSLTLQVFSIVLTLKAIESNSIWKRIAYAFGSILTGWVYLALVEFSIGMEAFRILAIFLFLKHNNPQIDLKNLSLRALRGPALFLLIPVSFVFWYQFIFDNWRKAQQASVQLGRIFVDPRTILSWGINMFQGFLNVTLLAWVSPFNSNFYHGELRDFVIRFSLAALVIAVGILAFFFLAKKHPNESDSDLTLSSKWSFELLWVGLLGTLVGVMPVVLANRTVTFNFSQYGLPASLAGILFLGGLVYSIFPRNLRIIVLSILIGLASLTHQAIAYRAASEEKNIYDFWWQVSWRAPSIRAGTTLLAEYPFGIGDNDSLVWGPANFIYYPEQQYQSWAVLPLSAITMQPETIQNIMIGKKSDEKNLIVTNISYHLDYRNMLVMLQPNSDVCVRIIDSALPEYSNNDNAWAWISGPYSKIDNILLDSKLRTPPQPPFGDEPAHTWCYYYQKAELARQQENWDEIVRLGDEAMKLNLHPNDQIEWMPFFEAYALTGNIQNLDRVAKSVKREPYYRKQICKNLLTMNKNKHPIAPAVQKEINHLFCDH